MFVTIVKNNGELVRKIGLLKDKQRQLVAEATLESSPLSLPEALIWLNGVMKRLGLRPTTASLKGQIKALKAEITVLTAKKYTPYKVYIIFNLESSRKNCIYDTAVSERTVWRNSIGQNKSSVLLGAVLKVTNTTEPGDIIYEYSDIGYTKRLAYLGASYALTIGMLAMSYGIIDWLASSTSDVPVAIAISVINVVLPQAMQYITFLCEIHNSQIDVQKSILFKLLAARCINSALLIFLVTSYDDTFGLKNLERVQNILLADAVTTPLFQLANPLDLGMRYVAAPLLSTTQAQYNKFWIGAEWNLAERYSDVLKSIFVGAFFAPLLPSGWFITAFAIMMTYIVDKYSLFCIWRKAPSIGPDLAYLARYFYFITVFCHLHIALIYFANWPYRGVFDTDQADPADCRFLQCSVSSDMTDDQKRIVSVYSLSTIIAFAVLMFWGLPYRLTKFTKRIFYPYRKDRSGDASDVPFRSLEGRNSYIPVVMRGAFLTPYIVAHIANIPKIYIPIHSGLKWEELPDPKEFSVFNKSDFVQIPDEQLKRAISTVSYYNIEEDLAGLPSDTELDRASLASLGEDGGLEMLPPMTERPKLRRQISTRVQYDSDEEDAMPTGWEKRMDEDGNVFYVDNNTNLKHMSPPEQDVSIPKLLEAKRASLYLSPTDLGADSLFEEQEAIVQVMIHKTSRASMGSGGRALPVEAKRRGIAILPPGWEEMFTDEGVPYFVDHNTRTSQWTLPSQIQRGLRSGQLKRKSV